MLGFIINKVFKSTSNNQLKKKNNFDINDFETPISITKINDEILNKIIKKYMHDYSSIMYYIQHHEQDKELAKKNFNAFEIGCLLYFIKENKKIHTIKKEKDSFPSFIKNMTEDNLNKKINTIVENYSTYASVDLSEKQLKNIKEWNTLEASYLLYYASNYEFI